MSVRLTVTQRSEAGAAPSTEVVLDDAVITLGRDKACQVVLPQQAVSRNHARIVQEGTLFFLEDLGSAYGTQVNGKPLPKGEKRLLRNGDVIAIAQYDVRFDRMTELNADVNSEKTSFIARGMVKDAMRGSSVERYLRFMNGPREGQRIELGDTQEIIFGRDEKEVDVVLKDDLVSRKHAKIRRDWSGTHVEDLGSRNGIKVNKKRVNRKALKDSDELEVGATRFLYVDPSEPAEEPVQLSTDVKAPPPPSPQRPGPSRQMKAVEEPPPEEPAEPPAEEPASAPEEPAEAASSEEPAASAESESASAEEPASPSAEVSVPDDSGAVSPLKDKKKLVPLVVMGVVGLLFLVLTIAVLAGA
ncbi:FHA domain-containing protein [Pyxidicoccus parkwayensis]|uniref:FHA domain-containing protein n=1 Tax=Pyxidicoccus parkwayensis TaxID=2813578 RepID=A0ABX7NMN8_9BACT|nr:FHA domain-containing protein [Pyxidicoccus parkwaysis]QSQ18661.1 FHA domain-containing protein [Pyxidicoccus parkwaysis]